MEDEVKICKSVVEPGQNRLPTLPFCSESGKILPERDEEGKFICPTDCEALKTILKKPDTERFESQIVSFKKRRP